jgi:hypothetical protein
MSNQVAGPHLLPREKYPFTIEYLHARTRKVVSSQTIEAPEHLKSIRIEPWAKIIDHPVAVRLTFADGEVQVQEPQA